MADRYEASESRRSHGRRRHSREDEHVAAPTLPMLYGIFSCALCCTGPVAFALGGLAFVKANAALGELPAGRRGESARKSTEFARILGGIGMCLSTIALVVAVTWNVVDPQRGKPPVAQGPPPPANQNPPPPATKEQPPPPVKEKPPPTKQNPPLVKENAPPVNEKPMPKIVIEPPKFFLVSYKVAGNPTPAQQADRVKQALDATAGVVPGSVEVFENEIRFRLSQNNLVPVADTVTKKLGYKITGTTTAPIR